MQRPRWAVAAVGCLALLEGEQPSSEVSQAAHLLTAVVGQDLEKGEDGGFRIARRVAPDRIISTVDPEARHGHKTDARSFDGYKGHVAIDPDGEVITALAVTAGNVGDASVAAALVRDCLASQAVCRPERAGRALRGLRRQRLRCGVGAQ